MNFLSSSGLKGEDSGHEESGLMPTALDGLRRWEYGVRMKDILALMARYNQFANARLYDTLQASGQKILTSDAESYFGSIIGLLNHIMVSDLGWLTAYKESPVNLPCLDNPVLEVENPGWKGILHNDLTDLRSRRDELDSLFINLVATTASEVFKSPISLARSGGSTYQFIFGKILMHLFNHQTHHRGAISQILDSEGVENDYSNILPLLLPTAES